MFSVGIKNAHAFFDPTGPAQVMYLTKILLENYKRYKQIREMISQAKDRKRYLELLNAGIENSIGILHTLPIEDEQILSDLKNFNKSLKTITEIYGMIPKSKEAAMHMLHDNTVAESLRMINDFKRFAKKQEENSTIFSHQGRSASPKGAARMSVESNAMILKSLSQLMRLETQNLKLQSEMLAMKNRSDKKTVSSYNQVNRHLGDAFKNFKPSKKFLKF